MTKKPLLTLNEQHDYITLRTPNGNFTRSWCSSKATGLLGKNNSCFMNIENYINNYIKTDGATVGEAMKNLTDPKILTTLFPDWNLPVEENSFSQGQSVTFKNPIFLKKYPNGGVVESVKKKYVYLTLTDTKGEVCGFDYLELKLK